MLPEDGASLKDLDGLRAGIGDGGLDSGITGQLKLDIKRRGTLGDDRGVGQSKKGSE
jgi:hypothetical protein